MRTSVLDGPDIGARAKEIADERLRNITQCVCARPDGGGEPDRSKCPVHREPGPVDLPCGFRPGIERIDDWLTWEPGLTPAGWLIR